MRVVVLLGGESEERDVSLASGCQVADALRQAGHEVVAFDPVGGALTRAEEAKTLAEGVGTLPPGEVADGGASVSGAASAPSRGPTGTALSNREEIVSADVVFPALHGGMGVVVNTDGTLAYAGVNKEVAEPPNYDEVLAALKQAK